MVDANETEQGTTRYSMLETLAQYARERLDEHGDIDRWRRRHAEHFANLAEDAGPSLLGPDELVWRDQESVELDNLRAAVMWAIDRDDPDDIGFALRIIGALAHETIANPAAGIAAWAERALPNIDTATPQLRYSVTAAAARHQFDLGNHDRTREIALTAIGDGVPPESPAPADAHCTVAVSSLMLGEPDKALAIALESAQQLDRDTTDPPAAVFAHSRVSIIASSLGDPIARPEAELALSQARESANPTLLAGALHVYAIAMEVIGDDPVAALGAADESITLGRHGASPTMLAAALVDAARMRIRTGDLPRAARDVREGIERSHQSGTRITFYSGVWVGTGILIGADELEEAAVFDGIASTFFTTEYLASAGTADWTHLQAAIASARTAYRPDHYDAAFQTGAQMNYDQAVEHTLRVLDDVIKETGDTYTT